MAALFAAELQRSRMGHNARHVHERGWLRPGISLARATDILWIDSSAELYDLLVFKSRWSARRYGEFIGSALVAALLPHESSTDHLEQRRVNPGPEREIRALGVWFMSH